MQKKIWGLWWKGGRSIALRVALIHVEGLTCTLVINFCSSKLINFLCTVTTFGLRVLNSIQLVDDRAICSVCASFLKQAIKSYKWWAQQIGSQFLCAHWTSKYSCNLVQNNIAHGYQEVQSLLASAMLEWLNKIDKPLYVYAWHPHPYPTEASP